MDKLRPLDWSCVLVFGAHPDDEIIGCGGTLARLAGEGARTVVVTLSNGGTGYTEKYDADTIVETRLAEQKAASRVLGVTETINLGYPSQAVVNDRDTYQKTVKIIRAVRPDVILCHWGEDKHRDHRAVAALVDEARWKASEHAQPDLGEPWYTPQLFFYEVHELFSHPSILIDVSASFERKIAALETQQSQLDVLPGVISYCRNLAQARGYLRGSSYAEAFLASNLLPQLL